MTRNFSILKTFGILSVKIKVKMLRLNGRFSLFLTIIRQYLKIVKVHHQKTQRFLYKLEDSVEKKVDILSFETKEIFI